MPEARSIVPRAGVDESKRVLLRVNGFQIEATNHGICFLPTDLFGQLLQFGEQGLKSSQLNGRVMQARIPLLFPGSGYFPLAGVFQEQRLVLSQVRRGGGGVRGIRKAVPGCLLLAGKRAGPGEPPLLVIGSQGTEPLNPAMIELFVRGGVPHLLCALSCGVFWYLPSVTRCFCSA